MHLPNFTPSPLHNFAVFLSPDFFKKMMAINLDLLLPSAPKKCPNCRTKKSSFFGERRDDGEDKKEKGDVCFMEIMKWWLKITLQPFGWMVVKYDSYFTFKQNHDIFYTFFSALKLVIWWILSFATDEVWSKHCALGWSSRSGFGRCTCWGVWMGRKSEVMSDTTKCSKLFVDLRNFRI